MSKFLFLLSFLVIAVLGCSKPEGVVDESELPTFAQKVNAKLGDGAVELVAFYTEPLKPQHGQSFKVVAFWRFNKELDPAWKMFYHLEDESGEQRFVVDRVLRDGNMKKIPLKKIIRDDVNVKELPRWFDSDKLLVRNGFYKGDDRLTPEAQWNDGKGRLKLPPIETTKPKMVKKQIKVYAVAGESRDKIKIDGKLNESFWANAQTGGKFWKTDGSNMSEAQTNVMVAMDDKNLYFAFDVEDEDITATLKNNDDPIYDHDDVVEVFIDGDGDKDEYWEMQVSAGGVKFDSSFKGGPRQNQDKAWDSKMRYAVTLDGTLNDHTDKDKGWKVEIAIPWETIADSKNIPPKDGDIWKTYFYRIDRNGGDKQDEFTAWVPPYKGDFHYLRFMGDMIFVYEEIL